MNIDRYKKRLLDLQRQLDERSERDMDEGRGEMLDTPHDTGDASVSDVAVGAFLSAGIDSGAVVAARDPHFFPELAEEPFILFTEDFRLNDLIRAECRACGFTPTEVGHSGQWDFIAAMVAADHGIALLPLTICRRLDPAQSSDS